MPIPLVPVALATLGLLAWRSAAKRDKETAPDYGVMTNDRQVVYNVAMNDTAEPEKIENLATAFEAQGLPAQADMLRKRAALRRLPDNVKAERREVFKKAMSVTDPAKKDAIRNVAAAFHGEGAVGAAEALYRYAESL